MGGRRRRGAIWVTVSLVASLLAALGPVAGSAAVAAPSTVTVAGAPLSDVVVDRAARVFASNPARNQVEVLSLATGALEAPILVGSRPRGLDLSPDGTTLYVANSGANDLSVVDVPSRREVRRITVPRGQVMNDRPFSVAVASTGTVLVATTFEGSGFGARMMEVDVANGTARHRTDFWHRGTTTEATRMKASRDRSRIGIVVGNISSAPVFFYDAATDTFSPEKTLNGFVNFIALDATGSKLVVTPGTHVLDRDLVMRATIPGPAGPPAVNGAGTTGYRAADGKIEVFDMARALVTATITVLGATTAGQIALTAEEDRLVVLTPTGISLVRTSEAVPIPACTPPARTDVVAVCGAPLADIVIGGGRAYASNRARNQIEVIALATGRLEAPIPVGSKPWGLDLSADGRTLYVANTGANDISVVDLTTRREVRRITLPPGTTGNDRPFSIAVANNGVALVTTTFAGSGYGALLEEIDLASGAVTPRGDFGVHGHTTEATRVKASGDRSRIGVVVGNISNGPVYVYDAATGAFSPPNHLNRFVSDVALDASGARLLVNPGGYLFDRDLVLRATIGNGGRGVAMNSAGATGYTVQDRAVDVIDLDRGLVNRSIALPELAGAFSGGVALTPDGETLAVLTASGVTVLPATLMRLGEPSSRWAQPEGAPLDGVGGWLATGNDPSAAPGQLPPSYFYGQTFSFTGNAGVVGAVGLVTQPNGKYAMVSVLAPDGTPHTAAVAFNWTAGRYYFPFVYQLSPGRWGAWVYDFTAGAWVAIGVLDLPSSWGKLAPATGTTVRWFGGVADTCAAYPLADVYFYPPFGYVGTAATVATGPSTTTGPGECAPETSLAFDVWAHYRVGG